MAPEPHPMIRPATTADLDTLVALEERVFAGDRLSRRSLRHLLTRGHAATLAATAEDGTLRGYVLVLYHRGTSRARLYSIAVDPAHRGQGVAAALVGAAEQAARGEGYPALRLEIRRDNAPSLALFRRLGYREFGIHRDYYEDGMDAVRLEKALGSQS